MKVRRAFTLQSIVPSLMQSVHWPNHPSTHNWGNPVSWWNWPSGSVSERQPGSFIHLWLDCCRTILADAITVYLVCVCVCVCVCTSAHTHFLTQRGQFCPEELIACPIDSKSLRDGGSDRWREHGRMESALGWMSGDRLFNPACTTNLLCDLGQLTLPLQESVLSPGK